ncbi:igLON family member 5-like [Uloborus diversus]|uniref:igLON family member 5-like n=1 Tax=Uloborus diversus TaxID=327109 RepID=UPI00240A3F30|nr:igLON family member 5-like [Uloborus diversus]
MVFLDTTGCLEGEASTHLSVGYELLSCLGSNLRLQCELNVTCNDRVQWRRILDDRTFEGHALQLRNVHQQDSGTYQCEVVDRHGRMKVKREVTLTVQFPPIITVPNKPSSEQEGHLECSSEAVPRATIKWYKGSMLLHPTSLSYSISSESSHCTTRSILFFNSSSLIGQGAAMFENYTCVAENDHGSSSATMLFEAFLDDVTLEEVPEEKRRFNVTGFIVGMLPPLFISFYIIVKLGYRSRYAEERGEDDGFREEPFFISY